MEYDALVSVSYPLWEKNIPDVQICLLRVWACSAILVPATTFMVQMTDENIAFTKSHPQNKHYHGNHTSVLRLNLMATRVYSFVFVKTCEAFVLVMCLNVRQNGCRAARHLILTALIWTGWWKCYNCLQLNIDKRRCTHWNHFQHNWPPCQMFY